MRGVLRIASSMFLLKAATHGQPRVRYLLTPELSGGVLTALRVEVRFRADPSGVIDFLWSDCWAGEAMLWQWTRDFLVTGATAVEKIGDGRWRVRAGSDADLKASYRIVSAYDHDPTVEDSDKPKPVVRPHWFYVVGSVLFGYPEGYELAPASFEWSGPSSGFGFASNLEHLAGEGAKRNELGTVADVVNSIVIGGHDLRTFAALDGSGVRVATVGSYAFTAEQLDHLARRIINVERDFWGADRHARFLVTAAPIVSSPTAMKYGGTSLGDGFALWVDQRAPLEDMKWLLAHEYFHTWNPTRLGPMPEDQATQAVDYWFSEGLTDYYARALMVRAGLISPAEFAAQWNAMLAAYAASPVRNMPAAQAAAAFWESEAAHNLPYQRGAMLAAMWNARLLAISKGKSNLDTVMKAQLAAAQSSTHFATDLFRGLALQRGLDIGPDEARYLMRGETITLPPDTFGPYATVITEQRPAYARGFNIDATAEGYNIAVDVDPLSPAYVAGLRDGMKILARTEGEPENALVPIGILVEDRGLQQKIRYLPQGSEQVSVQQVTLATNAPSTCGLALGGHCSRGKRAFF